MSALPIIGSLAIARQLDFIKNQRLGFDKDHVAAVHNADRVHQNDNRAGSSHNSPPSTIDVDEANRIQVSVFQDKAQSNRLGREFRYVTGAFPGNLTFDRIAEDGRAIR